MPLGSSEKTPFIELCCSLSPSMWYCSRWPPSPLPTGRRGLGLRLASFLPYLLPSCF